MRSSTIKFISGSVVFLLPTIIAVATSRLQWNVPAAFWVSIALAGVIPPWLVLSSSVKGRFAFAAGLWVLLVVQFSLIVLSLLAGFRE